MSPVQTPKFTSGFWVCPAPNTVYVPANDAHRNCTTAQHTPISGNVDIDGIAVAVGTVVTSLCLPLLITWSKKDNAAQIYALLLQQYPIIIASLWSYRSCTLSLFDVGFALVATASPFTILLLICAIDDLLSRSIDDCSGGTNFIFRRIKGTLSRRIISLLSITFPFLWLSLSLIQSLSSEAYLDSYLCRDTTFKEWLENSFSYLVGLPPPLDYPWQIVLLACLAVFVPYGIRHRRYIHQQHRIRQAERRSRSGVSYYFELIGLYITTISKAHTWILHMFALALHVLWSWSIIKRAILASGPKGSYILTYGQVVTLGIVLGPLGSTIYLIWKSRRTIIEFITALPKGCWDELRFVVAGLGDPLPYILDPDQESVLEATGAENSDASFAPLMSQIGEDIVLLPSAAVNSSFRSLPTDHENTLSRSHSHFPLPQTHPTTPTLETRGTIAYGLGQRPQPINSLPPLSYVLPHTTPDSSSLPLAEDNRPRRHMTAHVSPHAHRESLSLAPVDLLSDNECPSLRHRGNQPCPSTLDTPGVGRDPPSQLLSPSSSVQRLLASPTVPELHTLTDSPPPMDQSTPSSAYHPYAIKSHDDNSGRMGSLLPPLDLGPRDLQIQVDSSSRMSSLSITRFEQSAGSPVVAHNCIPFPSEYISQTSLAPAEGYPIRSI